MAIINKYVLIRIYKRIKRNPLRVFLLKDFFHKPAYKYRGKYLDTLKALDLIEEVPAIYKCGKKFRTRRMVKGYRLKC